ncbi:MAG: citrate synthase [Erysipelotrichaceae bacterium]
MSENYKQYFQNSLALNHIDNPLYSKYFVKKGLRNEDGTGVLVGLTKIADVVGYTREDGLKKDAHGILYYRGIDIRDVIKSRDRSKYHTYEEICFLLLFGYLPTKKECDDFERELHGMSELPENFLESNLLREPAKNLMNKLQQTLLMLYPYDSNPDDASVENTLAQGLSLIAKIPAILIYSYQAKQHYFNKKSLVIHQVDPKLTFAQSILHLLREDMKYTQREADILDLMLVLHADHGGGNNSTFTNVVISSTGTDIYSSFVGSIGALKGPKHGGANIEVSNMMECVINEIGSNASNDQIRTVIKKLLNKEFYDKSGLIYGMGHAVYTLSDPRAEILKEEALLLAQEKGKELEFNFYIRFEEIAKEVIFENKGIHVSSNVDFYSGFVYDMLNIPKDLFTPMFVMSRSVGWLAHNIENKLYDGRIVRPATKYVGDKKEYIPIERRNNEKSNHI